MAQTQVFSPFAIIAIESIWPSPEGYDIQNTQSATSKGKKETISKKKGDKVLDSTRGEYDGTDYPEKGRGYYRIFPLNVIGFSSTVNVTGDSSWNIDFTMDDIVLVGENNTSIDGLRGIIPDILGNIVNKSESLTMANFRSLHSLGFSAKRISTPAGMFTLEDIITPGDTATIWFYNDPKEFSSGFQKSVDVIQKPFVKAIIGSGDRTAFYSPSDEEVESLSFLDSSNLKRTAQSLVLSNKTPKDLKNYDFSADIAQLSYDAVDYTGTAKKGSSAGLDPTATRNAFFDSVVVAKQETIKLTNNSKDDISGTLNTRSSNQKRLKNIQPYNKAALYVSEVLGKTGFAVYDEKTGKWKIDTKNKEALELTYFILQNYVIGSSLKGNTEAEIKAALEQTKYAGSDIPTDKKDNPVALKEITSVDALKYLHGRNQLISILKTKLEAAYKAEKKDSAVTASNASGDGNKIKRGFISTDSHGETGYIVIKGHVKSIESSFRNGAFEVSIKGGGMEYMAEKHTIFYDDALTFDGAVTKTQEIINSIIVQDPARAMLFIVNRFLPKQVKWGNKSEYITAAERTNSLNLTKAAKAADVVLKRGNFIVDSPIPDKYVASTSTSEKSKYVFSVEDQSRVFAPVNFMNLARMSEAINAFLLADPSGDIANSNVPYDIQTNVSVMQTLKKVAGSANIMELFVDEIGNLMYRPAAEAWERASQPLFTPIVFTEDVQSIQNSRSDESIWTLVDIMPQSNQIGNEAYNPLAKWSFGRAMPRPNEVPINNNQGLNPTSEVFIKTQLSSEHHRYGLRYQLLTDFYGAFADVSRTKAHIILRFYKDPLKKSSITVLGNPSYRAGNTVIVHLPEMKKRSNAYLPITNYITWINAFLGDPLLTEQYISADMRLVNTGDSYRNPDFGINDVFGGKPMNVSHRFIGENIVKTLEKLKEWGLEGISADLFPTTLWYYLKNAKNNHNQIDAFRHAILIASGKSQSEFPAPLLPYLQFVRLNNFVCTSYYIEGVTHSFNQSGGDASTRLDLSYGQDNIVLIHPARMTPLGYLSIERKVRALFPDRREQAEVKDPWLLLHKVYFQKQKEFVDGSFLHKSQSIRNTANYMHKLAVQAGKV